MVMHGVRVTIGPVATPAPARSATVILVVGNGTGTAGTGDLADYNEGQEVTSVAETTAAFGAGSIVDAATIAFALATPRFVGVRYDDTGTPVLDSDITSALDVARTIQPRPTLIIAPDLTWDTTDVAGNAIATHVQTVASVLGVLGIADADPTDRAAAVVWAGRNGGDATLGAVGRVTAAGISALPISAYLAARIAANDRDNGVKSTVSNKIAIGVSATAPAWTFDYEVASTDAQVLDAAYLTVVASDGSQFRVWGGTLETSDSGDPLRFMGVYRVVHEIRREVARILNDQVDKDLTPTFPVDLAGILNRYLRGRIARGDIASGSYAPDPAHADDLANGEVYLTGTIQAIGHARLIDVSTQISL